MEYKLSNELLTVKFKSLGGELTSIKDNEGIEYLWQGDPVFWSGQAPVLFPICGSLRNNQATTNDGRSLDMTRHGVSRKCEFVCELQTPQSITFSLTSTENTKQQFPYQFKLSIEYTLIGKTVQTKYLVENLETADMPFCIGGHPGFNCPLLKNEEFEDYHIVFEHKETCTIPTPIAENGLVDMSTRRALLHNEATLDLSHNLFKDGNTIILDEIHSKKVQLVSKNHAKGIQLDYEAFPYLLLWSASNQSPFVALEPWLGISTCTDETDVFEKKRHIQIAKQGEVKTYSFDITIL